MISKYGFRDIKYRDISHDIGIIGSFRGGEEGKDRRADRNCAILSKRGRDK